VSGKGDRDRALARAVRGGAERARSVDSRLGGGARGGEPARARGGLAIRGGAGRRRDRDRRRGPAAVRRAVLARGRAQRRRAVALRHGLHVGDCGRAGEYRRRRQRALRGGDGVRGSLEAIRVADFSHVMAGPYATHLRRLLGAEVIKIESPGGGDAMRYYGADRRYDGMAPAFIAVNAGKKSIVLDLKKPEELAQAKALVGRCDVVVENF